MATSVAITLRDLQVDTPQGRLFARCWQSADGRGGHRAPIVLFHDSLGCVELWRDFPERLAMASGRPVIAYDRLGFGRSDPHPGRLAVDFIHAEAGSGFRHLREALSLDAFIALGHSVGGGMAVASAAAHPRDCRALITESAQAFVEDRTLAGIRQAQRMFAQPGQLQRLAKYHGDKAAWVLEGWIASWLAPEFAGWNLDGDLRQVICPLLAIHGDQDEYGSSAHPQHIAGLVQGPATLRLLAGIGHVPHRESSEQIIRMIPQWIAGVVEG